MLRMQSPLKPIISKTDESFDPFDTSKNSLFVQLSETHVSWCILDNERNRYVAIESFASYLQELAENITLIRQPFETVSLMIENNRSTLIPAPLFDPAEKKSYLEFIHEKDDATETLYDTLQQLEIVNVYGASAKLLEAALQVFPGAKIFHHSSALIQSIWMNYKNRISHKKVFLHVRENDFDLLIFDGKQLNYYNAFHFSAASDIIYYVIFVMEQLTLNPEETELVLLGHIEKESEIYDLLYRYIRNIEFVKRNTAFKYSYIFNEIPHHYYYTLFNLRLCGL
jgi:hypothetical protein